MKLLKKLTKNNIWFVVHGGFALYLQGVKRKYKDIDIWVNKKDFYRITDLLDLLNIGKFRDIPCGKQIQYKEYEIDYEDKTKQNIVNPIIYKKENIIRIEYQDMILPCLSVMAIQEIHNKLYENGLIKIEGEKYHKKAMQIAKQFRYKGGDCYEVGHNKRN